MIRKREHLKQESNREHRLKNFLKRVGKDQFQPE